MVYQNGQHKMNTQEKKITLPLRVFLKHFLSYKDKRPIEPEYAELIATLDADETFCHVQFEDFDGREIENPLIWDIKDWKTCYLKWQMDKKRQASERHEANLLTENTERLAKQMAKTAGISDPEMMETFRKLARKIARTKSQEKASLWDTKLDLD